MAEEFRLNCSATIQALQLAIRNTEALFVKTTRIVKDGSSTVIEADQVGEAPSPISVVLDPTGTVAMPGLSLVCRGTACIDNAEQKVAAFRTASAG